MTPQQHFAETKKMFALDVVAQEHYDWLLAPLSEYFYYHLIVVLRKHFVCVAVQQVAGV